MITTEKLHVREVVEQRLRRREEVLEQPEKWVLHVADCIADSEVKTIEAAGPISSRSSDELVREVAHLDQRLFLFTERTLTSHVPYIASPLSFLDAGEPHWEYFAGEPGGLSATFPTPGGGYSAHVWFFFSQVPAGEKRLISVRFKARSVPGTTGVVTMTSTDGGGALKIFPFQGFVDATIKLLVTSSSGGIASAGVHVESETVQSFAFVEADLQWWLLPKMLLP